MASTVENLITYSPISTPIPEAEEHTSSMFEIVFIALTIAVGVIGNGILILVVIVHDEMRSVPNILIASLAIGDLLFLLVNGPFVIVSYVSYSFNSDEGFPDFFCKLQAALSVVPEGVTVLTLAALSYDRYNAIVRPMHRRKSNAVRQTYVVAISIWIISMFLALPITLQADTVAYPHGGVVYNLCITMNRGTTFAKIHEIIRCIVLYLMPLSIITTFYTIIAMKLMESSRDLPGESRGDATKQVMARRRLAKTVLVLVVLFGVCWMPHFIYRLISEFTTIEFLMTPGMLALQTISLCLMYTNSSINPIALCILSKKYREYFAMYLCFCIPGLRKKRQQPNHTNYSMTHTTKWTNEGSERPSAIETKTL